MLDTSPNPTWELADDQNVILRRKDANGLFAEGLTNELAYRCQRLGIPYSFKVEYVEKVNLTRTTPLLLGRTEIGRLVSASHGRINGTTLQISTTGYHTTNARASLETVKSALQLSFLEE